MVFYYVCRDVVRGSEAAESLPYGRTVVADLTQRYPEHAQQICAKRNKFGAKQGEFWQAIAWNADDGCFPADHMELDYVPGKFERVLVG